MLSLNSDSTSCTCKWIAVKSDDNSNEDADDKSDASLSTVRAEDTPLTFGVIALRTSAYLYEKRKRNLPGCFLFGCRSGERRIDVCLSREQGGLSRVHFGIRTWNGNWAVQNFGGETRVNVVVVLRGRSMPFELNPDTENTIKIGDLEIEIYCRKPFFAQDDLLVVSGLRLDSCDGQSQAGSVTTVGDSPMPTEQTLLLYIFGHRQLESRTSTRKFVSLDPWSSIWYVAKSYPPSSRGVLEQRIQLQKKLQVRPSYLFALYYY